MKPYPLEKYKFVTYDTNDGYKIVIAISTYAGKTVKACAKCNPDDDFNLQKGKELAAARCNLKVAKKRAAANGVAYLKAHEEYSKAESNYDKRQKHYLESLNSLAEAEKDLFELMSKF